MKRLVSAAIALLAAQGAWAGDTAGLVGIMNTSGTVKVNNFVNPKVIWTVYNVNDPAEEAYVLAYVAYKKLGKHTPSIEWTYAQNKPVDRCKFDQTTVTKMPWVHTLTCKWGGRLPDGGIRFTVFNTFEGQKEKVGEMFIPPNTKCAAVWLRRVAPQGQFAARSSSFLGLPGSARAGLGLAPLPTAVADAEPELVRVLGPVEELSRIWRVLVAPDKRPLPRVAAFFDFVVEEIEALRPILTG